MKPIKKLRKHHVTEVKYEESLWSKLERLSESFHNRNRNGQANYIVCSSDVANMINSMYEVDEIEVSDFRIEDDSYVRDIFLKPKRTTGRVNITTSFKADTWQNILE